MLAIKHKFTILFLFVFTSFASAEISQSEQLNKLFDKLSEKYYIDKYGTSEADRMLTYAG